jgi:hypothetical protein
MGALLSDLYFDKTRLTYFFYANIFFMKQTSPLIFLFFLCLFIFLNILRLFNPELFYESNFIENIQVITLLFTFFTSISRVFRKKYRPYIGFYSIASIVAIFLFLEEISYGQHILLYTPPDFFLKHSSQQEFNLHNLQFMNLLENIFITLVIIICIIQLIKYSPSKLLKKFKTKIPNINFIYYILFLFFALYQTILHFGYSGINSLLVKISISFTELINCTESIELITYLLFATMIYTSSEVSKNYGPKI